MMRTYARKYEHVHHHTSGEPARPDTVTRSRELRLTEVEKLYAGLSGTASPHVGHNLSLISILPPEIGAIQAKPQLNQPDDEYEQEADRVAAQVLQMLDHTKERAQTPARLATRHVGPGDLEATTVPQIVHDVLGSSGQPLDPATRSFMTLHFGHDFSRVQIHADAAAEQSAQALNARAYTAGDKIVFGAGQFAPGTQEGRWLIAHELTHVVQQAGEQGIRAGAKNGEHVLPPVSLTSPVQVQREEIEMEGIDVRPKGLSTPKHVTGVSSRWLHLWQTKKDETIRTLLDNMLATVNAELSSLKVAPMVFDPTPSKTEAGFRHQEWRIQVNLDIQLGRKIRPDDKVSSLTASDLAAMGNSLYHEARHAEQAFLVARKRATTIRDPDALARALDMPVPVANAALRAGPPGPGDPGDEMIEEWAAFAPSGKYFAYWQWNESMKRVTADFLNPVVTRSPKTPDEVREMADLINTKINVLSTRWSFPFDQLVAMEKLSAPKPVDSEVLAQLRRITEAFNKLVVAIDRFRTAASLLVLDKSDPDGSELRMLDAQGLWLGIRTAQLELFLAQDEAYRAYPHEADARRAGEAVSMDILAATQQAPVR